MRIRAFRTLDGKLLLMLLLTSSLALLLAAGVYTVYQLASLRHELMQNASILAEVVAAQGQQALRRDDPMAIEQVLVALRNDRGIVAAHVFTRDGRSLAGFGTPATQAVFRDTLVPSAQVFDGQRLLTTRPIFTEGEHVATVLVESDLVNVYRRLTEQGLVGSVVMIGSFGVALAASMRMRRSIVRPISALSASAAQARTSYLPESGSEPEDEDEFSRLASTFNGMLEAIIERDSALRATQMRYRALVENAADTVLLFDDAGRVVDVNPRACIDLDFTRGELLGKVFADLCAAPDGGALPDLDTTVTSSAPVTLDVMHRRQGFSTYPAELRLARFEEGGRTWFLALSRDRTEHEQAVRDTERARAAAESASAAKTRFLSNVSHEIRTPMTSVVAMTELLGRSPLDAQQRRYVEIARHSADGLLGLLDDILELSWTDSGRLSLDSLAFHPEPLVDDVLEFFAQRASEKGIELCSLVDESVPPVLHGDPRHLRQILINLLGNAVKFTERGEVSVRVECADTDGDTVMLKFTVQDTGIGIPDALQRELFEPFVQQDSSSTRRYGGAGIGLTISRALVDLMGGTIGVDSELDAGSLFWFTVSLQRGAGHAGEQRQPSFEGMRALVMDANAVVRESLVTRLRRMGMTVETSHGPASASEIVSRARHSGRPVQLLFAGLPAAQENASRDRVARLLDDLGGGHAQGDIKVVLMAPPGEWSSDLAAHAWLAKPVRHSGLADTIAGVLRGDRVTTRPWRARPAANAPRARPQPRVLLADDDAAIRASLSLVLETLGYGCHCVSNGEEALHAIDQERFDLVLMDCQMPVMDGCRATRVLRSRETAERHLPVVGITGFVVEGERERCIKAGMDEYLVKPISINTLEAVLAARMDTHGVPDA